MESIQIYLNSINADKYNNGLTSDCEFNLPNLEIPDGYHIYLSVNQCSIPYSFYNINSNNNSISLYNLVSLVTSNYTLEIGNYNINNLISILNNNLIGYTFTYNNINNKINISCINNFQLLSTSTCLLLLGFNINTTYTSSLLNLVSVNCVDLYPINIIYLYSNLLTYNINKNSINDQSILCAVPIYSQPYSIIQYNNYNNFRCNLFINTISHIDIILKDEYGNTIDLNGLHFNLTIQLDIVQFT